MINANELHVQVNPEKKDPKTWIRSKAAKDLIDECAEAYFEAEGDDYKFSPLLGKHYAYYLDPLLVNKSAPKPKNDVALKAPNEEWYDLIYKQAESVMKEDHLKYVVHRAYEILFTVSYPYLIKELGVGNVWKTSTAEIKQIISAFLTCVFVEYSCYKKPIDNFYLNRLISENKNILKQHLIFDRTRTIFTEDKFKIVLDNRRVLRRISIE